MSEDPKGARSAVRTNGTCIRCSATFGHGKTCVECGVAEDRTVKRNRRRKIGGKRGRNSGIHGTAKNKK